MLPGLLRRDAKRLRRAVGEVAAATDQQSRDLALHESCKAAKRLRYAAERHGPSAARTRNTWRRSGEDRTDLLGEHPDSVVTRSVLRQLGVQAQLDGDSAFTFGLLYGLENWHAAALEEEFRQLWDTRGKTLRRIVG